MLVGFFNELCGNASKTDNATVSVPSASVLCKGERKLWALYACLKVLIFVRYKYMFCGIFTENDHHIQLCSLCLLDEK